MSLFGFNFTQNQALDYIKQNWKPGKREITYVIGILLIFILAEAYQATPIEPVTPTGDVYDPFAPPVIDYTAQTVRSMTVYAVELLAALLFTFLYFKASDKTVKNTLRWGVAYATPVSLISFVTYLNGSTDILKSVVSGILYLPADFFYGLLLVGGFYLLLVYKPKISLPIAGYVIMLVSFLILNAIIYREFSIYTTWALLDSVIGLSFIGLFMAVKNQIALPLPTVFLYAGIGLGLMIIYWISDLVYLNYVPYYMEFLAFAITGVVLYFLLDQKILKIEKQETLLPPPPPPPPPEMM